jgi:hypothetical protein
MCFIAALFKFHLDEPADGPSFQAELAFPYDSFVRLAWTLDAIFELAVSLGQLLGHLICAARGITIEDSRLQKYGLTELKCARSHLGRLSLFALDVILARKRGSSVVETAFRLLGTRLSSSIDRLMG